MDSSSSSILIISSSSDDDSCSGDPLRIKCQNNTRKRKSVTTTTAPTIPIPMRVRTTPSTTTTTVITNTLTSSHQQSSKQNHNNSNSIKKRITPIKISDKLTMINNNYREEFNLTNNGQNQMKRANNHHQNQNNNLTKLNGNSGLMSPPPSSTVHPHQQIQPQQIMKCPITPKQEKKNNDDYKNNGQTVEVEHALNLKMSPKIVVKKEEEKKINESDDKLIINDKFKYLLDACRKADPSNDMELLINKKLLRYYKMVHPDFVNSRSFLKTVELVTSDINENPNLVYIKLTGIIDELKIRRSKTSKTNNSNSSTSSPNMIINNDNDKLTTTTTGCEIKDNQIKRLSRALYILKKRIAELEASDVDFDAEVNSTYLQEQRYKKRAWEIYEKICDITGESKHAHRTVRKPITFNGTIYTEFNKAIQSFVNHTNTFPDYFDVIKCLEFCNKEHDFKLTREGMTKIAQDAFTKIGKSLQNRRRADLYESVTYFVGTSKDPAIEDHNLLEKLKENKKYHSRIGAIIDQFADDQSSRNDVSETIDSIMIDDDCDEILDNNGGCSSSSLIATITTTTNINGNINDEKGKGKEEQENVKEEEEESLLVEIVNTNNNNSHNHDDRLGRTSTTSMFSSNCSNSTSSSSSSNSSNRYNNNSLSVIKSTSSSIADNPIVILDDDI